MVYQVGDKDVAARSREEETTMRTLYAVICALLLPGSLLAADVGGIHLDDKVSVGGQALVLNGAGVRSKAIFKVYVGSLYLPHRATTLKEVLAQSPRRVQMNLLRNLSADQVVDALVEGVDANTTPQERAAIKAEMDQLVSSMKAFKKVKEKDVIALDFVDGTTQVIWNGAAKGSIPGESFNQALMKVWLGAKPIQADLKKAMLGG
jgi:chalcone isomerase-like protein